jgi:hypothetical protein
MGTTTRGMMRDVLIALLPVVACGILLFSMVRRQTAANLCAGVHGCRSAVYPHAIPAPGAQ